MSEESVQEHFERAVGIGVRPIKPLMQCGDCFHWKAPPLSDIGACLRFPPQAGGLITVTSQEVGTLQPVILWGSPEMPRQATCGEWRRAVPEA